jgi:flagellar biosynthesis protein FlhF
MRIVSFLAPNSKRAIADLKSRLGEDAVILSTRTLDDGQVSVTGAIDDAAVDLSDVLVPPQRTTNLEWLQALIDFHEWPFKSGGRIEPVLSELTPAEPELIVKTLIRALFRFDSICHEGRGPLLFSGPPGSGKTATLAKVAATQILAGRDVDVLSLDVSRAGGLNQLSTLLSPLELAPTPVPSLSALPGLIADCKGDVVLIDSTATNPFEPNDLGMVSTLVSRAGVELLLMLPAGLGSADSAEIARSYVALGARMMVVTKLDVARRLGGVLAAAEAGLAFTQAGIGPTIGKGICELGADGLARLLLRRYRASIGLEACG